MYSVSDLLHYFQFIFLTLAEEHHHHHHHHQGDKIRVMLSQKLLQGHGTITLKYIKLGIKLRIKATMEYMCL